MSAIAIAEALAEKHDLSREFLADLVRDVLEEIERRTLAEGRCRIPGYGTFELQRTAKRAGRAVRTGEPAIVPAMEKVVFRQSRARRKILSIEEP
jgi:nucleoid DNA-binding protein